MGISVMRECFDRHDTDKGHRHGYERVYEPVFADVRHEPIRLLEVGILRGNSLAAWVDYFPNASIFGIDTFRRVPAKDVPILEHPRVEWLCHNSRDPIDLGYFDFVIDDGLHMYETQRLTFENFMPKAGKYFIEDMWSRKHMTAEELKHPWYTSNANRKHFSAEKYQELLGALQPYDVKYHDLREGHQADSFIVEIA